MVLKNRRTLATTAAYSTGTTSTISLPRDFLIQRINLAFVGTVVNSGTVTLVSGAPWSLMKYVRVKAVGEGSSKTIFECKGEDIGNLNFFQYGTGCKMQESPLLTGTFNDGVQFFGTLDFRTDFHDPDDYSVSIPSYLLSTLQLEIEWDTIALGWGNNNTSLVGTLKVSLVEGIPEANDPDFSNNPLQTTLYKELVADSSSASVEDFSTFFNVGALIRTNFLITETSGGVLSDSEIDYYTVTSGTIPLISKQNFRDSKSADIEDWGLSSSGSALFGNAAVAFSTVHPLMNQPAMVGTATPQTSTSGIQTVTGWTAVDFMNPMNPFITTEAGSEIDGLDTSSFNVGDLTMSLYKNAASSIIRTIQITVEG
jgi:hypothetical protein|tara:strand:- start:635 stop:1741 length:1107 start_codon:yes stop_codon:yes gene_type:complete